MSEDPNEKGSRIRGSQMENVNVCGDFVVTRVIFGRDNPQAEME